MLVCLFPQVHPPVALLMGAFMGLVIGNPYPKRAAAASQSLLKLSVIGLGFGITASQVASVGLDAALYTFVGITATFAAGVLLVRLIKQPRVTALLITAGTAICGGSAIAAIAPAVRAKDHETSIALATVFTLNAVALLIFPPIGHALNLTQPQFGVWAAMAIHDTSSVVGACATYGPQSLAIGTIIKLTRALWIVPIALIAAFAVRPSPDLTPATPANPDDPDDPDNPSYPGAPEPRSGARMPWFLLGFILAALLRSFAPPVPLTPDLTLFDALYTTARQSLVLTIFLIGAGLTPSVLRTVGLRPMILALTLWILASVGSLLAVMSGLIPLPDIMG